MNSAAPFDTLNQLKFDNRVNRSLPVDPSEINTTRQVHGACVSRVLPENVIAPHLVAASAEMLEVLNLAPEEAQNPEFAEVFSGNKQLEGMDPYAWCYGGHQFGNWAGQLGDGRAINLGEVINRQGEHWVLQLKGAGMTPYSRMADGLAVMRSSVREFLCSEAMHHLGVPTTRALSLVSTGEQVMRDMFYNGNAREEPGAVVCRMAPSFIRFGNFDIHPSRKENDILRQLTTFVINSEFSELGDPATSAHPQAIYIRWFNEVCRRTADLMVHWMRVGFVHGVMNTDNMSILGLTIDYGPYGWLENFDLGWTPNTTDASGKRYCYGNQPQIGMWNINRLANAIYPLIGEVEPLEEAIRSYSDRFNQGQREMMAQKLGFAQWREGDDDLISGVVALLQMVETDMTLFYRMLSKVDKQESGVDADLELLQSCFYDDAYKNDTYKDALKRWLDSYRQRLLDDNFENVDRKQGMDLVNPKYVLRNYLAQIAIDKAEAGDYSEVKKLLDVMRKPYEEQPGLEQYAEKRPLWAMNRPGCSMLSCSS